MLTLGFSPCPNDTFIFHALVHGLAESDCDADFATPLLKDVETLNEWALEEKLDVTKLSFHAFGHVMDKYVLLSAGSALGRGCGPLIVARKSADLQNLDKITVAIPGKYTTAAMLLRLYAPACKNLVVKRFDEIMPCIAKGEIDAGVIIHESRFTYQELGLVCVRDLGEWWEKETGHPIPLGGIAARRSLGWKVIRKIDRCIRASVKQAFASPEKCNKYIKEYAQELDDNVIESHIKLYVNRFSEELGLEGISAIQEFIKRGRKAGIFGENVPTEIPIVSN